MNAGLQIRSLSKEQIQIINQALRKKEGQAKSEVRIKKSLLENSSSSADFEEARTEWGFVQEFLFEEDKEFNPHCQLCGAANLRVNFLISNERTGKALKVGSTCIQKFLLLGGAATLEDSKALFQGQVNLAIMLPTLRIAYQECLEPKPHKKSISEFRKKLQEVLNHYGRKFPSWSNDIDYLVEWLYASGKTFKELGTQEQYRLRQLLHEPNSIPCITEKQRVSKLAEEDFRWFKNRKSTTYTSLSGSSAYQTDYKYSESKLERTSSHSKHAAGKHKKY